MLMLGVCTASAQLIKPSEKEEIDPKYLAGAVPLQNGKVIFSRDIQVPESLPTDSVYNVLHQWMGRYFNNRRHVLKRIDNGCDSVNNVLKLGVVQYIIFKQKAFVLDRSQVIYNFAMKVEDKTIKVSMDSISYFYEEERSPIKYTAEEWISDETALKKDKKDIYRQQRKFRIKTIDLFDYTCGSLMRELARYGL